MIKLGKVCFLSLTLILANITHYSNPKRRFKMPVLLLTSSPCHSHSFQGKEKKKIQTHIHGKHIDRSDLILICYCPCQLINSFEKWILDFICLHVMSGCDVHYANAVMDWLLTASSFIMHGRNEVPKTWFFSVWLHEYTKRLEFLCAGNQTINVSLPCLNYI